MDADEAQARMLLEHAVACRNLFLVGRASRRAAGHVVLRVFGEVFAVAADRHLLERQPGIARFALVAEHRHAAPLEPVEQRVEARVVDHHRAAIGVALLHADVLPELDRNGALGESGVQALLDAGEPAGPLAASGVEGGRKGDAVRVRRARAPRHRAAGRDRREVAVVDVDRQDPEAVGLARATNAGMSPYRCTCTSIFSTDAKSSSA